MPALPPAARGAPYKQTQTFRAGQFDAPIGLHVVFSKTMRKWSSSSRSKHTLFALTPEVNA